MNKLMITTMAAVAAVAVNAQEFGGEAAAPAEGTPAAEAVQELPPETGTGAGVEQMQQALAEEIAPAPTAEKAIDNYLSTKDWGTGYDEEKDRIVVKAYLDFDIKNPKVSTGFLKLRKAKMDELCLMGKAKIIESIMSKMSGSRILEIPGNPIAKQLEKENREMNKALAVARENIERLDKDLAEALKRRDNITPSELVAVISSWFTKADKENLGEKLDAQKKADYAEAKNLFLDAEKTYKELAEKAEAMKGTIKSKMKTSISSISEMPIYGCTVLQQAESITRGSDGKYKYQIAILYAWSGEMMDATGRILKGEQVKFKPGKRTVKQWINSKIEKGAIAQWIGPRQYIDDKGNMWFLGISATPTMDDSDDNNQQREISEFQAKAEVMFSLYADARSSKRLETLTQTKVGANGAKEYQTLEDYAKEQSEAFNDIMISGNQELYSGTVRHAPSGLDIQVVIYGVNSGNAKTLQDVKARAVAMGIEVNKKQEEIRGYDEQLKNNFEESKKDSSARARGAGKAKEDIRKHQQPKIKTTGFTQTTKTHDAKTKGNLNAGTQITIDDDDED